MKSIHDIFTRTHAALAPLAGVTDSVYRRICAKYGARPVMTEMISSDGYVRSKPGDKTARFLRFHESERPVGFQFFGADPSYMAEAVRRAQELGPDFIDINAGCPVKKVIARGAGSALMRNPDLLRAVVGAVTAVSRVPVTVKIRSGWDNGSINAVEVAQVCEDAGAQGIIVHPRTRSQGFGGDADWGVIRAVKEKVSVPVIGSGDIRTPADALRMLGETGADSVMIGRAALGNPWIFRDVAAVLGGGEAAGIPDIAERLTVALRQLDVLSEEVSERFAVLNMRKFFGWYSRGVHDGARFRQEVFRAGTADEVRRTVAAFLESLEKMVTIDHTHTEVVES
ncbi:tRNA dihydrouridine synthase DusB [bacterium]|nr:tRNA dihydrouridine synthase DusB [bacterium]